MCFINTLYQSTPNEGLDLDGVNEFFSFDLKKGGEVIKAGAKADRNGFFYVINRTNGKLISANPFVMRQDWATGVDLKTGRSIETPNARLGDPAKAEGKKGSSILPFHLS
ncbi:MAG: hypothetical protein P1U35_05155 [Cycloclasticus sp.]|nr:hypothetical protein [Cycloclasticus sp.]